MHSTKQGKEATEELSVQLADLERLTSVLHILCFSTLTREFTHLNTSCGAKRSESVTIKTISALKATQEGHTLEVLSESFLHNLLQSWFMRRYEARWSSVMNLFENVLK